MKAPESWYELGNPTSDPLKLHRPDLFASSRRAVSQIVGGRKLDKGRAFSEPAASGFPDRRGAKARQGSSFWRVRSAEHASGFRSIAIDSGFGRLKGIGSNESAAPFPRPVIVIIISSSRTVLFVIVDYLQPADAIKSRGIFCPCCGVLVGSYRVRLLFFHGF